MNAGAPYMNKINDDAIMSALGRQMTMAVAKQVVASGNLANVDTPGYHTRDVKFDDVLAGQLGQSALAQTQAEHRGSPVSAGPTTEEVANLPSRRDGNNVQIERELLQMSGAANDFSAAQTVLSAKFRLIRYAINEGR